MINILVDEAYAFDYLSILDIKKNKTPSGYNAWLTCYTCLEKQFDSNKWLSMIHSQEYSDMITANLFTFEAVEKAKDNKVSAKYVDECNYQRYIAKQNFQRKFFNSDLSEKKIGYEIYIHNNRTVV
jgi:hypothetical protein